MAAEQGGRAGLGQGGEDPGPDRVQGGFGRGGLFEHGNVQHRSSVIRQKFVKEKTPVGSSVGRGLSRVRRTRYGA